MEDTGKMKDGFHNRISGPPIVLQFIPKPSDSTPTDDWCNLICLSMKTNSLPCNKVSTRRICVRLGTAALERTKNICIFFLNIYDYFRDDKTKSM